MSERLPDGWVATRIGWWKSFGVRNCDPCATVVKTNFGRTADWQYRRNGLTGDLTAEGIANSRADAMRQADAAHKNAEADQLHLRREAAQLYDGDFAAAGVGEGSAG